MKSRAYARAGLLGNPSDGFGGKTISVIVKNYWAEVTIGANSRVVIIPTPEDNANYDSVFELIQRIEENGYYGGTRIIKAAIKRFVNFASKHRDVSCQQSFSISYQTNIPRNVGLAGSSAIVVATLKALSQFFDVDLTPAVLASLALSVEKDELGIPAGLQDRVIQAYECAVFMDFSEMETIDDFPVGIYETLDPTTLTNLYIAFGHRAGEPTETLHGDLRSRFESGNEQVVAAMLKFAELAEKGRQAIKCGDQGSLDECIDQNFDLRRQICDLNPFHIKMIETARACGVSAKFCGSGGAIIGTYPDDTTYEKLANSLSKIDCEVIRPILV